MCLLWRKASDAAIYIQCIVHTHIKGLLLSVLWPPTITLTLVACVYVFWGSQMSITGCFVAVICNLVCQTRQLFASHSWEVCSSRFDSLRRGGGNTECSKIKKKMQLLSTLFEIFLNGVRMDYACPFYQFWIPREKRGIYFALSQNTRKIWGISKLPIFAKF